MQEKLTGFTTALQHRVRYAYHLARLKMRVEPYKYIFILSHMRAGSTLFVNLLNTNPNVCGYGEAHLSYNNDRDLDRLVYKVKRNLQEKELSEKYVVDKILHNGHSISKELIQNNSLFFIFLLREPHSSLSSMVKLWKHDNEDKKESALKYYTNYYVDRLNALHEYAELISDPDRSIFITHDQMLENTQSAFYSLQQFLKLNEPFSEEYKTLPTAGIRGIGDPSDVIKQGKIVRDRHSPLLEIKPELLDGALNTFEKCRTKLQSYCTNIN